MSKRPGFERTIRPATPILAVLAVGALLLLTGAGAPTNLGSPAHPNVGETTETCTSCHEQATPEVHRAWYTGKHGLNNVKCFVCHGSLTERFAAVPSTDRCGACHSKQLEPMETFGRWTGMEESDCFSCHPPHRLSPHAAPSEPTQTRAAGGTT